MRVTVLGCGGSGGVPLADGTPGGNWGDCDPAEPRNRRSRVSILVEAAEGGTALLIDASPDLRRQILDNAVARIDAVIFTHAHADHCHGLDELRAVSRRQRGPIPAYMSAETRGQLTARFDYAFESSAPRDSLYPALMTDLLLAGPTEIGGLPVVPFVQGHGPETTLGLRIGDLAYSTDAVALDEAAFAALEGVRLWIVDALRERPHPTHSHFDQTLAWIARVAPERAILTHMNQEADYRALLARCPPGVEPAYDGLVVELPEATPDR